MRIISIISLSFILLSSIAVAQENADYEDAYASYELGQIDKSYIYLKRSLQNSPDHLPSKMLMAEVLALSGFYVDALSGFEESIDQGADLNLVLESYVRVLMVLDDYGEILDIPEEKLTPVKKGFLRSAKATTYSTREEYSKAAELHGLAYEVAPKSINVLNSSARFFLITGNTEEAKSRLDESFLVSTENSNTYELLAEYYEVINDPIKKIEALHKGLDISDTHPVILRELVSAYADMGNFSKAKVILEKTLETSPNDPMARLLLSWIAAQLNDNELSRDTLTALVNQLSLMDSEDLAQQDYTLFVSAMANYAANNLEVAKNQLEQYVNRNPKNFEASKLLADIFEKETSYIAAANTLEPFPDLIDASVAMIARLCRIYIKVNQNHKCNSLLQRNQLAHGDSPEFVQVESNLLAARGKLDLALDNLAKLDSNELSVLAQTAVFAIQDNQLNLAKASVERLLVIAPGNADFLNLKASILMKEGNFSKAEEVYNLIMINKPSHFPANFNLTHIYYLTNRLSLAKSTAIMLLERSDKNADLLLLHASILIALEEYEGAFNSIVSAEALSKNNAKVDEAFIELYLSTREFDNALIKVNKLLKDDLTNIQLIRQRAGLLFELGRDKEAHTDLRVLYGLLSDDSQALFQLSDIQGQYADLDGALNTLKRADLVNPGNLFINRNLAKLALVKKDKALAEEKITWLSENAPNNPDVLLLKGDLAIFNKDDELAATHYLNAVRLNNTLAPALIGAYKLAQRGIKEAQFVDTFSSLATEPSENTFSTHLLADYFYAKKDFVNAKIMYVSLSGQSSYAPLPVVLNNLANIYIFENKIDAAYNFAQQAYEIVQKDPAILDTLGWITVLRGSYDQGLSLLRQAYSMNGQDPDLRYHLAYALNKLGRDAESKRELNVLLNDFPNFKKREEALALQQSMQ